MGSVVAQRNLVEAMFYLSVMLTETKSASVVPSVARRVVFLIDDVYGDVMAVPFDLVSISNSARSRPSAIQSTKQYVRHE